MAFENLLARLIAQMAKHEATKEMLSKYGPPSHGDILHDGLVGAGGNLGRHLGISSRSYRRRSVRWPSWSHRGWSRLGINRRSRRGMPRTVPIAQVNWHEIFSRILSIRASALLAQRLRRRRTPALSPSIRVVSSPYRDPLGNAVTGQKSFADDENLQRMSQQQQGSRAPSVFDTGASPVTLASGAARAPRGLPGLMADAGLFNSSNSDQPPGGLFGLIQESMRNNPAGGSSC